MRLRKSAAAAVLLFFGILLCAGNLWFTAERSTIPRSINGILADKTVGREKHHGIDDVYWLILQSGEKLHVDATVFDGVTPGEHLRKDAWSRTLHHGSGVLTLEWSDDFRGMLWGMPAAAGILAVLGLATWRRRR